MYTREEASKIKQEFWTKFGRYMLPVLSAEGEKVNWVNYKTGISNVYFRMNATKEDASISIDIMHKDPAFAEKIYQQFILLRPMLEAHTNEAWEWHALTENEHGQLLSRIVFTASPLNIFKESDWPGIISFLKPRLIALDSFWGEYKMVFEMIS